MQVIAKVGPAFQPEQATLGTVLAAGAVVVLIVVVFLALLALVSLAFRP